MSMKDVIILTGNHLRHDYIRIAAALSETVNVVRTYCEDKADVQPKGERSELSEKHLRMRARSEEDFFASFVKMAPDTSNAKTVETGGINSKEIVSEILDFAPDVLVAYGCSLVDSELIQRFSGCFINIHLGLSPYYRGTATNFWPLVNNEPEFVGATFMFIDEGVDTGNIIHQIRAEIYPGDSPHQLGNRLILQIPKILCELVNHIDDIKAFPQVPSGKVDRVYRRKDFSEEATRRVYLNFANGMIDTYINEQRQRIAEAPIVINPLLRKFLP